MPAMAPARLALLLAVGIATPARAAADGADYAHANDLFGRAVAVDGEWAAVGAIGDDTAAFNAGAVYMYRRTGDDWALHSRLVPEDSDGGTWLGNSLALAGDTLIAGSTVDGTNARTGGRGAARIYTLVDDEWREQAVLRLGDDVVEDAFGYEVALDGDDAAVLCEHTIVEGIYRDPEVHLYRRQGEQWYPVVVLPLARGGKPSVALAGDTLVVGGVTAWGVAVYRRDGDDWSAVGELERPGTLTPYNFGAHVVAHGDTVVVSADVGFAVYGREDGGWDLRYHHEIADGSDGRNLQRHAPIALRGEHIAVGIEDSARFTEEVHLFERGGSGVFALGRLVAADASNDPDAWFAHYGSAMALADDLLLVGAMGAGTPVAEQSGAVYVYRYGEVGEAVEQTQVFVPDELPAADCQCRGGARAPALLALLALLPRRRARRPA
jgi:hypothetical protein